MINFPDDPADRPDDTPRQPVYYTLRDLEARWPEEPTLFCDGCNELVPAGLLVEVDGREHGVDGRVRLCPDCR